MRYPILFLLLLFTFLSACNKDKFSSTPSLKFKSVNTRVLQSGQQIEFTLSFTDAEGDLSGTVFVQEVVPNCTASDFKQSYQVPAFPTSKNQKGDLTVTFGYNTSNPSLSNISPKCMENDTATFRFALIDKAMHVSDTVSSPPIILVN